MSGGLQRSGWAIGRFRAAARTADDACQRDRFRVCSSGFVVRAQHLDGGLEDGKGAELAPVRDQDALARLHGAQGLARDGLASGKVLREEVAQLFLADDPGVHEAHDVWAVCGVEDVEDHTRRALRLAFLVLLLVVPELGGEVASARRTHLGDGVGARHVCDLQAGVLGVVRRHAARVAQGARARRGVDRQGQAHVSGFDRWLVGRA